MCGQNGYRTLSPPTYALGVGLEGGGVKSLCCSNGKPPASYPRIPPFLEALRARAETMCGLVIVSRYRYQVGKLVLPGLRHYRHLGPVGRG